MQLMQEYIFLKNPNSFAELTAASLSCCDNLRMITLQLQACTDDLYLNLRRDWPPDGSDDRSINVLFVRVSRVCVCVFHPADRRGLQMLPVTDFVTVHNFWGTFIWPLLSEPLFWDKALIKLRNINSNLSNPPREDRQQALLDVNKCLRCIFVHFLCSGSGLFIQEAAFDVDATTSTARTNINKWVKQWEMITGSPPGCLGRQVIKLLQSFVLSCVVRQRSHHRQHLEHYGSTHTAHQHTYMFPLQWMWET